MHKKSIITYLIIFNLLAILLILLSKIQLFMNVLEVLFSIVVIPIIFGVFLFYILKPLNNMFIKNKMKRNKAAFLTITVFLFLVCGIIKCFGDYFIVQANNIKSIIFNIINQSGRDYTIQETIKDNILNMNYYNKFASEINSYINLLLTNLKNMFSKGMALFSNILLVFIILFYLLKDEYEIKEKIIDIFPKKYKNKVSVIVEDSDEILSTYVIGQAKVATALSIMMYIGYSLIGMPSGIIFSALTFILAFIPFIGFFISLVLPYIIAVAMGMNMILKLTVLVIIAQTLKGRIIVPFIMGKTMKIHPITDIFLVVGAATLIGPIGAFVIVPLYSILKIIYKVFKNEILDKLKEIKD